MIILVLIAVGIICFLIFRNKSNKDDVQTYKQGERKASFEINEQEKSGSEQQQKQEENDVFQNDGSSSKPKKKRQPIDYSQLEPYQIENEKIKNGILNNMENGTEYSLSDMLCTFDCFPYDMTPHRLSALLSQLGPRGTEEVERFERDGKAYFKLSAFSVYEDPSPREIENAKFQEGILENMEPGTKYSLADILCTFDCFPADMTPHRLTVLLSQLGQKGTCDVERYEDNGKAFFALTEKGNRRRGTLVGKNTHETKTEQASPASGENVMHAEKQEKDSPVSSMATNGKRINYFCSVETVNSIFQMKLDGDYYTENAFTLDITDAPYVLFYKSDSSSCSLQINNRYEVYKHEESSGSMEGTGNLTKGEGLRMRATDSVKDIIPLLMVFCNTLSVFSKEQGYDKQFDGLNPEDAGVLLESNNGRINARIVKGDERPDMMCKTITGDAVFCRPYESDLRRKVFNELMKNRQEQE